MGGIHIIHISTVYWAGGIIVLLATLESYVRVIYNLLSDHPRPRGWVTQQTCRRLIGGRGRLLRPETSRRGKLIACHKHDSEK